jgi:glycosyltransferase involved in cell wall biosynthesis
MRIAICVNDAWNVLNFRIGLVRAMRAAGHELLVIAPPGPFVAALERLGLTVLPWELQPHGTRFGLEWRSLRGLYTLLRAHRPDVVLSFTIKPNVYGGLVCRWLGIPFLANITGLGAAFQKGFVWARLARALYALALGGACRVFFQNRDDQQAFVAQRVVHPGQTVLLPGSGVDLAHFRFQPMADAAAGGELRFLLAGRLLREKGVAEYAAAAALLKAKGLDARFQLLGDLCTGNPSSLGESWLHKQVASGAIQYLGTADDVRPVLAQAHVVVLPSYREGTPRSLLEAMAIGRPLVAADVPGCRDVVTPQANGVLCAPMDVAGLAAAMETLATLPFARLCEMGEYSRRRVENEYDEKLVILAYQRALDEVA